MMAGTRPRVRWARVVALGLAGACGFWLVNFSISLTPMAADYRAALGISYFPMLGEALLAGTVIGFVVSYCFLRFYGKLPTRSPVPKAVVVSLLALVVATVLVEIPPWLSMTTSNAPRYVPIGLAINLLRFLALGIVVGSLHGRLDARPVNR